MNNIFYHFLFYNLEKNQAYYELFLFTSTELDNYFKYLKYSFFILNTLTLLIYKITILIYLIN